MSAVFDSYVKQGLEYAGKLKAAGEDELSRKLCVKCAMEAAQYNGKDVLRLFYGKNVYSGINGVADAVVYVFIAACAARVYDKLYAKNAYASAQTPWAKSGGCDARLREFFGWLGKRGRIPKTDDQSLFWQILAAYGGDAVPEYKVSDRLSRLTVIELIDKFVSGEVVLSSNGEIK